MLRTFLKLFSFALLVACFSGCNWDLDFGDWNLFGPPTDPALGDVPPRLALGATASPTVHRASASTKITVADSSIVALERLESSHVELTGLAVGRTTVSIDDAGKRKSYPIEVATAERFEVQSVERAVLDPDPIASVALDGHVFLAGVPQPFVVNYYDSVGPLYGSGLAELVLPPRSEKCSHRFDGPLDDYCLVLEPGPHVMQVRFAGEDQVILLRAVSEENIADLRLLQTREQDAEPGDVIRVFAVGVSTDGSLVYGMRQNALSSGGELSEAIAYQFNPDASPSHVIVVALNFERDLTYRGNYTVLEPIWSSCQNAWFGGC